MTAFVFGVIAVSSLSGSRFSVSGWMSTNTGVAPVWAMASTPA